jgi:hypothetical protein
LTPFASLGGIAIQMGTMNVPGYGVWHADVWLTNDTPDVGTLTALTLGDITAPCAVIRDIDVANQRGVRVVGGFGGWRKPVLAEQYATPGLMVSTVLLDTAALVGETVMTDVDASLGTQWLREAGPASNVLHQLAPGAWFVGFDGVTHTLRAPGVVASTFQVLKSDQPAGQFTITTDFPSQWLPGSSFAGPVASGIVSRVMHRITAGAFVTEVQVV